MDETATATTAETTPPPAATPAPVATPEPVPAPPTESHTATADKFPLDQLALMDDKSALFFGIVPLVIIGVLAIVAAVVYLMRRGKNWNDLGDAMRIDDGDKPVTSDDSFNTKDIAEMEPTKPSQRITELSRHPSKSE